MKRFLNSLIKFLAYAAAGTVILLAIAVGLFRLFLPRLPEYQDQIKSWASDAIGMQVEFSGMDARWGLRGPELKFYDAELIRMGTLTRAVAAEEVSVGVGLMRLLVDRKLVVDRVTVRDTDIEVRQLEDGRWWVQGATTDEILSVRAGGGSPLGNVEIVGENIELRFLQPGDQRPRFFDVRRVLFRRDDDKITLDADARLPDELGRRLRLSAIQLLGVPRAERSWDIGAEIDSINLAAVSEMLGNTKVGVAGGSGDIELSLVYAGGDVQSASAILDIDELSIDAEKNFGLAGVLEFDRHDDGWLAGASQLVLATENGDWPESELRIDASHNAAGELVLARADVSYIDLADVQLFSSWFPEPQRTELALLSPQGVVRDLALTLSNLHRLKPKFEVDAEFVDIGFAQLGDLPGIRGFSGSVDGSSADGALKISSRDLVITHPKMFPEPLTLESASAEFSWINNYGNIVVHGDDVSLQSEFMETRSTINFKIAGEGAGPEVNLTSTFSIGDLARAKRFIPADVVKPKLYDWFQNALESGSVPRGSAVLYGPLDKFPFDNGEGRLLVSANVRDASLKYHPSWPAADLIDVNLVVDNARLYTEEGRSANTGNQVVDAKIEIADLRQPVLTIDAFATGTLETVRQFVMRSPLTNLFGGQVERIEVDGEASFDLKLMIPIKSPPDLEVTTRIRSNNGRLLVQGFPAPVTDLSGVVTVTRDTLSSESLGGTFLGQPISMELRTASEKEPQFAAVATTTGVVTAAGLVEELGLPLADVVSGASDYELSIRFPKGKQEQPAPVTFDIESDLVGMAINLPPPFGKSAETPGPVAGDIRIVDGGARIESSGMLGDDMAWQLSVINTEGVWDFDRGVLALGGELIEAAETRGLHILGSAAEVRLQDWLELSRNGETQFGMADRIRSIDVYVAGLYLLGQHLVDHRVKIDRSAADWLVQFEGESVSGSAFVPYDFGGDRAIVLDMDKLHLPGDDAQTEDTGAMPDPRNLPPISLRSADFALGNRHLGAVVTEFRKTELGLEADTIEASDSTFRITNAKGGWIVDDTDPTGQRTYVQAELTSTDVRATMARLDYKPGIVGDDMAINLDLSWSGGPSTDYLSSLDGTVDVRFGSGQLDEVEPGAGRMFGLISITALPRRLSLDFRDVFDKGFGFDSIGGTFRIENGEAYTCNLSLEGPAADIGIVGRVGLYEGNYEQTAVVSANVGNTLPIVGAVVAGPQAAAAMFLFTQIFKKPLREVGQVYYGIDGSWDTPVIETSNAERFAKNGELAGCLQNAE